MLTNRAQFQDNSINSKSSLDHICEQLLLQDFGHSDHFPELIRRKDKCEFGYKPIFGAICKNRDLTASTYQLPDLSRLLIL